MAEQARTEQAVAALVRMVLNVRMVAVLLTMLWTPYAGDDLQLLSIALVVAAVATLVPLLMWERVGGVLLRHPSFLGADLLLVIAILSLTGPESPFFYFTVGTALLGGVLYGFVGGGVFSVLLIAIYLGLLLSKPDAAASLSFQTVVGLPALYVFGGTAGAAVRRLLLHSQRVELELEDRSRDAVIADERARLAREMHDSLAKTIHGIALSASVLPDWIERSPERASSSARSLAAAAKRAAGEARELIGDLRSDRLDQPLPLAVRTCVQEWSAEHGITADLDLDEVGPVAPEARYELFCILKEALRNIARHAAASRVTVTLGRDGDQVVLTVTDDGRGLPTGDSLADLAADGHYGLVGMDERARRLGGVLDVEHPAPGGLRIVATMPSAGHPAPGRPATAQGVAP